MVKQEDSKLTLSQLRQRAGLTQKQFAEKLEGAFGETVDKHRISSWETGRHKLSLTPRRMLIVIEILGCTLEELASATENGKT